MKSKEEIAEINRKWEKILREWRADAIERYLPEKAKLITDEIDRILAGKPSEEFSKVV